MTSSQPDLHDLVSALRSMQKEWEMSAISVTTPRLQDGPLILHLVGLDNPILTVEDIRGNVMVIPEFLPSER